MAWTEDLYRPVFSEIEGADVPSVDAGEESQGAATATGGEKPFVPVFRLRENDYCFENPCTGHMRKFAGNAQGCGKRMTQTTIE